MSVGFTYVNLWPVKCYTLFVTSVDSLVHCKKYDSTSPNLGKQLPFFGTEILRKTSLNQSYNNLEATFFNLVRKRLIFNTFGKVLPRIGTLLWVKWTRLDIQAWLPYPQECKASPKDWH